MSEPSSLNGLFSGPAPFLGALSGLQISALDAMRFPVRISDADTVADAT